MGAVAIGLGSVDVPVPATVALVGMSWKFTKPVRIGESIAARWRLNRKRDVENPAWGLVTWQVDVIGADGEVKAQGEVSRLVARREAGEEAAAVEAGVNGEQPAKRRRRRRSSSTAAAASAPAPAPEAPEPAPADTPPPSRRRRRGRRGGGGGGGNGGNGGALAHGGGAAGNGAPAGDAASPDPPPPPAAPEVHAAPAAPGDQAEAGIGGVLKRIRRRRT